MDVMELNGGRFYLRPLHDDERIDDRPALKKLRVNPDDFISMARISLDRYCWAICEQTSVEMVALGVYDHALGDIVTHPIGDPNRVLPNDPVLPPKTVQDAADDGLEIISRWVDSYFPETVAAETNDSSPSSPASHVDTTAIRAATSVDSTDNAADVTA